MKQHNWRLPDGVDELLPPDAWRIEQLRRQVLDLFDRWGYDYVMPPMIEFLDALLVGSGHDLELQTFRMVDPYSGRMLGIRADMTSQAARIDANSLQGDGSRRLCYAGTVVHAKPEGVLPSRVPLLAGAEVFGTPSLAADAEVVALMVDVLRCGGVDKPVVELGHVGIFRALAAAAGFDAAAEQAFFAALQRKSEPDLAQLIRETGLADGADAALADYLLVLPTLLGEADTLSRARKALAGAPADVGAALAQLESLAEEVSGRCPKLDLRFDLCELTGYGYHTGVVFAAYSSHLGRPIARGGRYDAIGTAYGRARPATGFDVNLKRLPRLNAGQRVPIWAPALTSVDDLHQRRALWQRITALRDQGERVLCALDVNDAPPAGCQVALTWQAPIGEWTLQDLTDQGESKHGK
jgi:ATP phosphoribosyltransferase regulatory subunit